MPNPQSDFQAAREQLAQGLFGDALKALTPSFDRSSQEHRLLMAEALWRVGQAGRATALLGDYSSSSDLSFSLRSREILGQLAKEDGRPRDAIRLLGDALKTARILGDTSYICRIQLAIFGVLLDQQGAQACESFASELRQDVIRSGDPLLFTHLHIRFAEFEARAGNLGRAFRHLEAGFNALHPRPNAWVHGQLSLVQSAIEWVSGSISDALRSARRARDAAKISGHERTRRAAISNIGFLSLWAGDLEQADAAFSQIGDGMPKGGHMWFALLDSKVIRAIKVGDVAEAERYLTAGETELRIGEQAQSAWPQIEFRLARARLEAVKGRLQEARVLASSTQPYIDKRGDPHLRAEWALESSALAAQAGDTASAGMALDEFVQVVERGDLGRAGDLHWLRAHLAFAVGKSVEAAHELARAERIWSELGGRSPYRRPPPVAPGPSATQGPVCLQDLAPIASLLALGARPRLLGREAVSLIGINGPANRVRLVAGPPGSRRVVEDAQRAGAVSSKFPTRCVELGEQAGVPYQLQLFAGDSPGAAAALSATAAIVDAAVRVARLEREERFKTSLWPVDEGLQLDGNVFVAPRMREIQTTCRRVATSEVQVLITGETGSGKEVIAREVHDASPRGGKSFGVIVCSGVPREMLDSHLFGHRRGAFTGAIDNFLGVIRANEGGTIFLDEIGEVSTDLQVKLLRFLETGEVHPLGETKPVKVDVRVIAATNQPLEELMKQGRFREDLFYRLNVVRLKIPPLRERREEILPFFERFLIRECSHAGRPVPEVTDEAVEHLLLYTWPGNVRQLLNEVKRILAVLPPEAPVTPAVLSSDITSERHAAIAKTVAASQNQMLLRTDQTLAAAIEEVERTMLTHALATTPDLEAAAEKLNITRKGLFLKRQRLGLA